MTEPNWHKVPEAEFTATAREAYAQGRETISVRYRRRYLLVDARLTRKQSRELLAGNCPTLTGSLDEGPCPFKPGEEIQIVPHHLWIEIQNVGKSKWRTHWLAHYKVYEFRPHFMGRAGGVTDDPSERIGTGHLSGGSLQQEDEHDDDLTDWEDSTRAMREVRRIKARPDIEHTRNKEATKRQLGRILEGLSIEAQKAMLAQIERVCREYEEADDDDRLRDAA